MVQCKVIGCKSRSERKLENVTFHTFPKDTAVRKMWIVSTGRENWEPLKSSRICSKHFEDKCFRRTKHFTLLNPLSVPTLEINIQHPTEEPATPIEAMEICPIQHPIDDPSTSCTVEMETCGMPLPQRSPDESASWTPRKRKLAAELRNKIMINKNNKKKIAILRSKTARLQKKNANLTDIIQKLKLKNFLNQESVDMLTSLNQSNSDFLKPNKSRFSPEVKKFALNLHFISPRAYNFVRQHFHTCLPHTRTLARWYETVDGEPGFSSESLETLKLLTKSDPNKKIMCNLSFDEMAIRKCVQWDGKNFVGYVNYGQNSNSDTFPVAREALVFMLTSMNSSWKIPIGYFLIDGATAEQKVALVKNAIDLVSECGLNIVSLTFDGCPANFSMAKLLGCQLDGDQLNPVFVHNGRKIAIFPDPSHMLKLVRNTLGDKLYLRNEDGNIISWHFIQILVGLQEDEGCHLANKIRAAHINYKKQIMKVKLAAQTFSESVADAIDYCKDVLKLKEFQNSEATTEFIRKFNNLFDILNSRNLNAFGFKQPLNEKNFENIKNTLEEIYGYIASLKMGSVRIVESSRKTGFLGFLLCIKSIIFLFNEHVKNNNLKFLCSYKMSQDHLEIFFSAIRAKGGFNNNPTAIQFRSAFKRLLVHGELKHVTTGNCVALTDINILMYKKPEVAINRTTERSRLMNEDNELPSTLDSDIVVDKDHDYIADPTRLTEFMESVLIYIAGFVVKGLEKEIKCAECISYLTTSEKNPNTLQFKKDKGGLHYPSKSVIKLCEFAEQVYKANKMNIKKDFMHHLLQACLKKCVGLKLFSDQEEYSHFDIQHYSLLIKAICKKYLNVRIHYDSKSMVNKGDNIRNMYTKLILFKGQ